MPEAFKLDHLQPFEPILFCEISICFTFILGGQFLLPQRANSEKGEFCQFQKWMRQGDFSAWGIQTGPLHWQPFKPLLFWQFSKFFTFILGGQFLLPKRANLEKGELS